MGSSLRHRAGAPRRARSLQRAIYLRCGGGRAAAAAITLAFATSLALGAAPAKAARALRHPRPTPWMVDDIQRRLQWPRGQRAVE